MKLHKCNNVLLWTFIKITILKKKNIPVNNCLISGESKHSWFGVPLLRFGCDRANFNKAKPHLVKPVYSLTVLVKACRNPNGVFEL